MHINIEIKAKCKDYSQIRNILHTLNADFKGVDYQTDTYFRVNNGRLKLREGNIENHLIFYQRENSSGLKQSDVILFKTEPSSSLKEILKQSLGVLVEVKKQREIYFIENVKFHLDYVESLGHFVEIEAIDLDGSIGKEKLHQQCQHYVDLFKLSTKDFISVSYSDMLLKSNNIYL
jgi:predicted adenylyl cyclase CyaB